VLLSVPEEIRLGETALHPANGLKTSSILFLFLVDFQKHVLILVKLLQLLLIGANERVLKLQIWVFSKLLSNGVSLDAVLDLSCLSFVLFIPIKNFAATFAWAPFGRVAL